MPEIGLIILAVIIFIIIVILVVKPTSITKTGAHNLLKNYLDDQVKLGVISHYQLIKVDDQPYEYLLIINDQKMAIYFLNVPTHAEIIVNNKYTWELRYGGGNHPGKMAPNRRYLKELKGFLNATLGSDYKKVVIVSPTPKSVHKYINECEIVDVSPSTDLYGVTLLNEQQFDYFK